MGEHRAVEAGDAMTGRPRGETQGRGTRQAEVGKQRQASKQSQEAMSKVDRVDSR